MKKFSKILIFFCILLIQLAKVEALSVSKNNLTLEKGKSETIEIYANLEKEVTSVEFTLVYTTYDVPAFFTVNSAYTDSNPDGVKHTINFKEPTSGQIKLGTVKINVTANPKDTAGTINIHSATAKTEEESIKLNAQNINVTINEEKEEQTETNQNENNNTTTNNNDNKKPNESSKPKEEKKPEENKKEETTNQEKINHLIDKIESNIVKVELSDNVFEYEVTIKKEITELDLKVTPKDELTKIEISSQKVTELKDGYIVIKAKKDKEEQEYKIKVKVLEEVKDIEIDKESSNTSTYNYKGKWIVAIVFLGVMMFAGMILNRKK